jgi:O-antigen/teichoic acid export membrane protein
MIGFLTSPQNRAMRSILTLLASNTVGTVVGGVFFIVASWQFDLQAMGLYAVAISVQWIFSGLLGSGLGVSTIRLATDHLTEGNRRAAGGVVASAAVTAAGISVLFAGLFFALSLATSQQPFLPGPLMALAALWAGARSVLECLRGGLLAQQQFTRAAALMILSAITGLTSLGVMFFTGPFTLQRLLVAHVVGLGSAAAFGTLLLLPLWRLGVELPRGRYRELMKYSMWPATSEAVRLLQANLGPLVLVALAGSAQAGLFSLGRYPAYLFEVIAVSLYQYWLPTAVREEGTGQLVRFLGKQMRLAGIVGLGMLVLALIFRPAVPLLGSNFAAAAHLFVLNTLDFALFVLIRPIESVFHGMYKPWLEVAPRVVRLVLLLGAAFLLAPRFGAVGMVWAQVFSGLVGLLLAFALLWRMLDGGSRRQALDSFLAQSSTAR